MTPGLRAFAAAKVNLYLHVGSPLASGYHPISSLVVFADVGDEVRLDPAAALELRVDEGDAEVLGPTEANLVLRAVHALAAAAGVAAPAVRLSLEKRLPVAAGLGGGSADAAATLRLLNGLPGYGLDEARLVSVAAGLGADVPMCLAGRPAVAEGFGERLSRAPELPEIHAVLVNPNAACATAEVYRRFDVLPANEGLKAPDLPPAFTDVAALSGFLAETRNDLEASALLVQPEVAGVLNRLRSRPETIFARMSGSGATCFGLCSNAADALSLAESLAAEEPGWWVKPCRLGGPWQAPGQS